MFGRSSRMSGTVWKALPDIREALSNVQKWLGGSLGCPGVVGSFPGCLGGVGSPSRMSGSGRDTLPNVRELSGAPQGCPGVVEAPPGCPEGLPDVQEWLGDPAECPGVVCKPSQMFGRPSQMSGRCWEALTDFREWSRMFGSGQSLSRMSGRSRESLPDDLESSGEPSKCPEISYGYPGVVGWPSRMSGSGR